MRSPISAFAFLLSAFAVPVCSAGSVQYFALSTHPCVVTDCDGSERPFNLYNAKNGGYYFVFKADLGVTDLIVNDSGEYDHISANELAGLSFKGWYTKAGGWTSSEADVSLIDSCLETNRTITGAKIKTAGKWGGRPTIVAKYVAERTMDVGLSAFGKGTVAVSPQQAVYTKGDSVKLTVQPSGGYAFVRWSDGNADNPRTQIIDDDLKIRAIVEPNSYLVKFSPGDGAVADLTQKRVSYDCTYGELATCTRPGYTFAGWYTATSGGTKVESSTKVAITDAQTLYARWTANSYAVSFDAAGGTTSGDPKNVTHGSTYGTLPVPTRTGYTFVGWYTAATGGEKVESTTKVAITDAQTLYAHWTANEYELTVSPNGGLYAGQGIDQTLSTKLRYDAKVHNEIGVATRENYTLSGYYTSKSGGTKVYDENGRNLACGYWTKAYPNGTFKGTSGLMVHAIWTPNASTVTLDRQGGTGGASSVSVKFDMSVPAVDSLPTRKGYDFEGYYTAKGGSGVKYYDANGSGLKAWTSSGTTVLYANWTAHEYRLLYDFNGGKTGTEAPSSAKVGTAFRLSVPTREGHVFAGWNVIGDNVDYETAKWGLSSGSVAVSITSESAVCGDASSDAYLIDLAMAKNAAVTLKANWTPCEYALIVNPNGGSYRGLTGEVTLNEKLIYGTTNLNEIGEATRTGYALQGYWTESGGGESIYDGKGASKASSFWTASAPDGTYKGTKDLRVYAHWKPNAYKVTFDTTGGSSSISPGSVTYDSTYGLLPTPTKTGYAFAGWWTEATGGTKVESGMKVTITSDQTLYAHWEARTYTVTIDPNGGIYEDAHVGKQTTACDLAESLVFGATNLNQISVATKSDSVFQGYKAGTTLVYDEKGRNLKDAQGTYWTADYPYGTYCHDGHLKLTAVWAAKTNYVISVVAPPESMGEVTGAGSYVEGSNVTLVATAKAGYSFWHWTKGGAEVSTNARYEFRATAAAEYAAVFTGNVYTVTYDAEGGTPEVTVTNVTYGSRYGVQPVVEREGYDFKGWFSKRDCGGDKITPDSPVQTPRDHDLFAGWGMSLASVLDCPSLTFTATADWKITESESAVGKYCLRLGSADVENHVRVLSFSEPGTLTFHWRGAPGTILLVKMTGWTGQMSCVSKSETEWSATNIVVESAADSIEVDFSCRKLDFTGSCELDHIIWTPRSESKPALSVVSGGNGSVTRDPDLETYAYGTNVTISATPDAGYAFEKWSDGSTESNRTVTVSTNAEYTASFTACVYRVTLSYEDGTGGSTNVWATYGKNLPSLRSLPQRENFTLLGFYDAETGGKEYYNADGVGVATWDKPTEATLFAHWGQDVGPVSRALDCTNLVFSATDGWSVFADGDFACEGGNDACLKTSIASEGLTATIRESGTLSFYWKCQAGSSKAWLTVTAGERQIYDGDVLPEKDTSGWQPVAPQRIEVGPGEEVTLKFACGKDCTYLAIDRVTWTPEN